MGGVHAGKFRTHKAHKVGAHLMLGFSNETSIHGSRGPCIMIQPGMGLIFAHPQ